MTVRHWVTVCVQLTGESWVRRGTTNELDSYAFLPDSKCATDRGHYPVGAESTGDWSWCEECGYCCA